ncbi:hypothetical protein K438DRAFT_1760418 [Mycena galopus ATCC 62051]|nr:hypothetical protein K438DRAFT_1760418 [Mycena galopus ATCC 62051]
MRRQQSVNDIRLNDITTCLTLALPLLNELHDAFEPPFVQSIANTIQTLVDLVQNIKQNKGDCIRLMENVHGFLYAIVGLHMKSEPIGSLPLLMLDNIGNFVELIYTFVEAQKQGTKIKYLFQSNEMRKLLKECHAGLEQAQEVFGIQTQAQVLNDIRDFKKSADLVHKELLELVEKLSDTNTVSDRSSVGTLLLPVTFASFKQVYLGANDSKNSSNSFSMLPSKPKIFHGREHEMDHILKLLTQQSPRIAILGGGGMGKTSLARAVLHHSDISSKFEHQFFVSAEAATTSVELAALIGLHLGLNPGKDLTKPVIHYFSKKEPSLLILDNLETIWEPIQSRGVVEEFLSLLTGIEHLALMITMRGAERPAKVQWSHPFLLPLQPLSDDAARQTFIEITDNSNTIQEMDQLLQFTDNMPLAVDLIAHLTDYEGFSNVLSRWTTEKTSLLSVGFDRQSSVEASITLSLSSPRITSDSKELLSLLSILPNGLSEDELVQSNLGIPDILSCKAALQATALTYRNSNQRLMVLVPIREYIQQILPPSNACIQLICRHFYVVLEQFMKYNGEQMKPVVNQITLNLANLHELLHRGLHLQSPTLADTIYCAISVNVFYRITGRDHFPLMDDIHSLLSQLSDGKLETRFLTELLCTRHYYQSVSDEAIAHVMLYLDETKDPVLSGFYLFHQKGDIQQGTQFLHKALEMSELCGNRNSQGRILLGLAQVKLLSGDYRAGHAYASMGERLSKLSANLYQGAVAHHLAAECLRALGNYQESMEQLYRGTKLLHVCGLSGGLLAHQIEANQGEIHLSKSEYLEARNIYRQFVEAISMEQNSISYAGALFNIGLIETLIGGAEEDISHKLKTAQEILRRGDVHNIILGEIAQAIMEHREEKFHSAEEKFKECISLSWGQGSERASFCLEKLANIKAWPASKRHHKWAIIFLGFASKSRERLALHKALLFLGDVFIAHNDDGTAASLYQVALEGFTRMDVHQSRAQCMLRLGDLANKHGHISEAITLWTAARPLFERSLQTKDVTNIDSRLENAHQQALIKLDTLHPPLQLVQEGSSETEGKDSVDEDAEKHIFPVPV